MTATLPPPPPSAASNVESRKVPLAKEFDQVRHMDGLHKMIAEKLGPEWRFARFEGPEDRPEFAIAEKVTSYITFLSDGTTGEPIQVKLNSGTKPTDAPWLAGWAAVQHPGYELVAFRPYEGWARLARLEPDASRCREAVAAVLGVGAWEVQISVQRNSRGEAIRYDLELPKYAPSKHDKGLTEVAQAIIGHEGWEVDIDGMTKKCSFIAGVHFGFSAKILPTPTPSPATANRDQLGWGERLNQGRPEVESINFEAHPHALVVGKAQPLDTRIPTPDGWTTIGDLAVGDMVFAADGTPTEVVGFSPITDQQVCEVEFDDGQIVFCSPDHLWTAVSNESRFAMAAIKSAIGGRQAVEYANELTRFAAGVPEDEWATSGHLAEITGMSPSHVARVLAHIGLPKRVELRKRDDSATTRRLRVQFATAAGIAELTRLAEATKRSDRLQGLAAFAAAPNADWSTPTDLVQGAAQHGVALNRGTVLSSLRRSSVPQRHHRMPINRRNHATRWYTFPLRDSLLTLALYSFSLDNELSTSPWSSVVTTRELHASVEVPGAVRRRNWSVRAAEPVQCPTADLPVDPYTFGAWLGDGTSRSGNFTQDFKEQSRDASGLTDRDHLMAHLAAAGWNPRVSSHAEKTVLTSGLAPVLETMGVLRNKHIPLAYLRSSVDQRLALLQGIMDTDGTISATGQCEITLSDMRLATDVLSLLRTLGIKTRINSHSHSYRHPGDAAGVRRPAKDRHRIGFSTCLPIFRLPRKAARLPQAVRQTRERHYITDIRITDRWVPMRCIKVAHQEHLYLDENHVPLHNTGSGKGVLINNLIANAVAAGWHVVLCEGVKNGTDFVDFRPFIAPGMWGCDSLAHAAAVLAKVELEYQRRRELIKANGAQKLSQLSDAVRPARWLVVIDEFATLTARDGSKGLSSADMKYLPEEMQQAEIARRMRSAMVNFGKQAIVQGAKDLAAKARFTGIHIVIASQRASTESLGGDGALRENLPWKGLLGVTSNSASALSMALNCPQDELPLVPKHLLREDEAHIRAERPGPGWLKGAGFVNADGQLVHIAKGWFFDPKRLQTEEPWRSLAAAGARAGNGSSMSVREVSKLAQIPEDVVKSLMGIKIELLQDDDTDDGADGGLLSAVVSAQGGWEPSGREICGSCDTPIDPASGDCLGCSK